MRHLRPIFRYNTKQIFVYLVADYSTPEFPSNEVVLWDRIIRNARDAKINLSGARNKYAFKHIGGSFKLSLAALLSFAVSPLCTTIIIPLTILMLPSLPLTFNRDVNATYTLHYNLMPKVGALTWGIAGQTKAPVPFPPVNYRKPLNR
ncbi:hypothetical protein VP01_1789g5 [Puccinia sorghi]|uniref:Signal peptidase subunit 3 n=1 Tax=Puccinia sorghi TaxID=27349 RepID=A0A0L6VEM8_9BASI|nr:hypothetical protein VP01_1789g5 [Puccinia sorghi]